MVAGKVPITHGWCSHGGRNMKYVAGAQQNNTKKSLGQHWLHDEGVLEAIAESAQVSEGDNVLEIGPGLGTLTDVLMAKKAHVRALEFDQDLISTLTKKYKDQSNVAVQQGDVRTFDFTTMPEAYKIVANIPYYLTSHLIRSISETSNPPAVASLLIQKEVAERLCAKPGQMGILSVTAQFYFACELDVFVPAKLFTPPPKVDSQVVVLTRRPEKLFDVEEQKFFNLVKAGFSEKRKTMRNSLSGGLQISKDAAVGLLESSGLKPTSRAQELSLEQWYKLYLSYESQK
jgi:16S rRNA (adenine1518-N6/adenine1519-N6)-dimethyltransferase